MRDRNATPDDTAAKVDRAHQLWSGGERRGALESLKTSIRENPDATELRRALAELYRDLGCPDQAGRWGISIDGWTTPTERDRLARLIASSWVARTDLEKFLQLTVSADALPDLHALMEGSVESYRNQYDLDEEPRESWNDRLYFGSVIAWVSTVALWLLAMMAVYAVAVFELTDPRSFARFVGGCVISAGSASLVITSVAAAVDRRPGMAAAFGVSGILCSIVATAVFITE